MREQNSFLKGIKDGIPICLGYLSISFAFGIFACGSGLSIIEAVLMSMTNLTSAGQLAAVSIIATGGGFLELVISQVVINLRYALMSVSLSQKLSSTVKLLDRFLMGFSVTDEIFAVSSAQIHPVTPAYMYGLILISFLGWASGTFLGAAAGEILPSMITNAMGIVLYGMFIAIIIPPSRKERSVLFVVGVAALVSVLFKYVFTGISVGFAVIISACIAAAVGALLFPVKEEYDG